jgi:hypothetical protein
VARALALFGMFAAHIADAGQYSPGGWRWLVVAYGRSSALFAVLAGVSIALMLARSAAADPVRHTRVRVAVRGAVLILLGWSLTALATPIDIILDNLGLMFLLALVAFRWGPGTLISVGAAFLALGKTLFAPLVEALPEWLRDLPLVHELWSLHYPALIWVGYVLIGMGVGRLAPWRGAALAWLAGWGLVATVVAYGTGAWLLLANGHEVLWASAQPSGDLWYAVSDHSYTAFEMLGNAGVACLVIAGCCWIASLAPRATWPLAAAGSMTLTLYTAQVLVVAIVGREVVYTPSNSAWLALCAGSLVFASLWRWKLGQGPLERWVTDWSAGVADADERRVRPLA